MTSPYARFICKLPSGSLYLAEMQFLRGYCILEAKPTVASLNDLSEDHRRTFLLDMARVGDVLLNVTGAYRINYAVMGNSQPILHAHIVPRYASEPDEFKQGLPWSYPDDQLSARVFDLNLGPRADSADRSTAHLNQFNPPSWRFPSIPL